MQGMGFKVKMQLKVHYRLKNYLFTYAVWICKTRCGGLSFALLHKADAMVVVLFTY